MEFTQVGPYLLGICSVVAVLLTYPFVATAIGYRRSDNGLAYLLFVMGVGFWNAMVAVQLLSPYALVKGYFYALAAVGASLAALGWFLFAATASSTSPIPRQGLVYGTVAVLTGLNIALIVTTPAHELYWVLPDGTAGTAFAVIEPAFGYWLHTQFLLLLFIAGTVLFAQAWESGRRVRFSRAYAIAGTGTVGALVVSNVLLGGGVTVAALASAILATIGWIQADQGMQLATVRSYLPLSE